jgi:hypothetical protein
VQEECGVLSAGCGMRLDPAAFPGRRGRRWGKISADRTSEEVKPLCAPSTQHSALKADRTAKEVESRKTKPTRAHLDCHKPCYGIALNSFGALVGFENRSHQLRLLPARGRVSLPRPTRGIPGNERQPGKTTEPRIGEIKANGSQGNSSATVAHAKGLRRIRKSIDHKASVCRDIRRLEGQGPDREPSTWRILM